MDAPDHPQHSCHNCRRQRLRCDRSVPQCSKCIKRGQECLGYQRLYRWQEGVASRGRLTGVTFGRKTGSDDCSNSKALAKSSRQRKELEQSQISLRTLIDPLLQDSSQNSRRYLSYFASNVCRNLVLYDTPHQNPFRDLIALTGQYPILLQAIVANSALHMSNASQTFSRTEGRGSETLGEYQSHEVTGPYLDALTAKQRALNMLRHTLMQLAVTGLDVLLAVMVLLIEFELMDCGRSDWKHHVEGARRLVGILCKPQMSRTLTMSPIRSCLISNWIVFDVIGSMFACSEEMTSLEASPDSASPQIASLLRDAEGNHCSSFPLTLLQLLQAGTKISLSNNPNFVQTRKNKLFVLVCAAKSFDPLTWALELQPRSPSADVQRRTQAARAHKAAVTIYLSRLLLSLYPTTKPSCDFEALVLEVVSNISQIGKDDALFTATTWPTFIAGAETNVVEMREWVVGRFRELWEVEPWGLMQGALRTLETIWSTKEVGAQDEGTQSSQQRLDDGDWIRYLRETGVNWLIL